MSTFDDFDIEIGNDILSIYNPEVKNKKGGSYTPDDRIYASKLSADNQFSYNAKLRLLYNKDLNNGSPSLKVMRHYFQDSYKKSDGTVKKWTTSHVCPKTFGLPCPTCDSYWDMKNQLEKDSSPQLKSFFDTYISKRGATVSYLWNVYVKDDKNRPELNGTVKAYYMTNGLYNIVQEVMYPTKAEDAFAEEDESVEVFTAIPFHPVRGVDLYLVVNKDDKGWTSYASSRFRRLKSGEYVESPIVDDPDALKGILNQCYDFSEFVKPDTIPSYDELKEKLKVHDEKIFGQSAGESSTAPTTYSTSKSATNGPEVTVPDSHKPSIQKGSDDYWTESQGDTEEEETTFTVSDDDFDTPISRSADEEELPF